MINYALGFIFDPINGEFSQLCTDACKNTRDVFRVGNIAYLAHWDGVYEFNLDHGIINF